jgi:hypothetical protein
VLTRIDDMPSQLRVERFVLTGIERHAAVPAGARIRVPADVQVVRFGSDGAATMLAADPARWPAELRAHVEPVAR